MREQIYIYNYKLTTIVKIGFLCSHGGSNMQAIIDNVRNGLLNAELAVMLTNNADAYCLERAKNANLPNHIINSKTHSNPDEALISTLKHYNVDTVVLAGYMKIISPQLIESFSGRVLNIHPALLPKFGGKGMFGMNVHRAVIDAAETVSGATVHQINADYDKGRILSQKAVPVLANDSPETLAERVLALEHLIYSDTLIKIESGEIIL